jgi:oxygen-independent coproporphyrinogen-3 oxidase
MKLTLISQPPLKVAGSTGAPWQPSKLPPIAIPGLYVHIPFCFHKCHYCDFYSITQQTPQRMSLYVDLLLSEAATWASRGRGPTVQPQTVFFGGGTPSLLPLAEMRRLIAGLRNMFDFSQTTEWTVECNPATVFSEYASMLRESGVTRLSFGAQSFDRDELKTLERHHDPDDVARSVTIARQAGFKRINVDLIYAIPGQDVFSWNDSLESAVSLGTEHISCYALTYEPNTPMTMK